MNINELIPFGTDCGADFESSSLKLNEDKEEGCTPENC